MIHSIDEIRSLLTGTAFDSADVVALEIPETSDRAFAIEVNAARSMDMWLLFREQLETTQRCPLIVTAWGGGIQWQDAIAQEGFFSRFYYEEEATFLQQPGTSPASILSQVDAVNFEQFLSDRIASEEESLEEMLEFQLSCTRELLGTSPTKDEITALIGTQQVNNRVELERWLFEWEMSHFPEQWLASPDLSYLEWFDPSPNAIALLLLPIANSWEALAYLHWFGACSISTPVAIAFLRRWHQQYGAELVCHYGTMLQFKVSHRPASPDAAFALAWEQEAIAPCTTILPGCTLRHHATALLHSDRWFLHERP